MSSPRIDNPGLTLYIAAGAGEAEAARAALAAGANPNARGGADDDTPLMQAAAGGHAGVLRLLLEAGAGVNLRDGHDYTALMHATAAGQSGIVAALLAAGARVDAQSHGKSTALSLAIQRGAAEVVGLLLDAGADLQALPTGDTPLALAAQRGALGCVEQLLRRGADVQAPGAMGRTPLQWAEPHPEVSARLLGAGARPVLSVSDAIRGGDLPAVRAWLAAGGDPNAPIAAELPLVLAVHEGQVEIVDALLNAGADVNARDARKRSALLVACERHPHKSTLIDRILLAKPTIDNPDRAGRTALWWAVDRGPLALVERLLAARAKPELPRPIGGGQPGILGSAVARRDPALLARVLAAQQDPAACGDALLLAVALDHTAGIGALLAGGVPLHPAALVRAASLGKAAATRALLAAGADPNARHERWLPLLCACQQDPFRSATGAVDFTGVIRALLEAGADPNLASDGATPLSEAACAAVPGTVALLLSRGARPDAGGGALRGLLGFRGSSLLPGADLAATLDLLLAAGADPAAADARGETVLHAIARSAAPEPIRLLLSRAPTLVHARDAGGATPLHLAAAPGRQLADNRREAVIAALLAAGADPEARDSAGLTPLDRARAEGRGAAIRALGG